MIDISENLKQSNLNEVDQVVVEESSNLEETKIDNHIDVVNNISTQVLNTSDQFQNIELDMNAVQSSKLDVKQKDTKDNIAKENDDGWGEDWD